MSSCKLPFISSNSSWWKLDIARQCTKRMDVIDDWGECVLWNFTWLNPTFAQNRGLFEIHSVYSCNSHIGG